MTRPTRAPRRAPLARAAVACLLAFVASCAPSRESRRASRPSETAALAVAGGVSTAAAPSVAPATARPARAFAKRLDFAILEDYDKGDDLADVARDFRLFRELGIATWRGSLGWDDYEPADGRFDFAWLHRFATLAAEHGIALRPYLGYTPAWAGAGRRADGQVWNDPPRDAARFGRYAGAVATALRRHPNVLSYEIYNEENVRLWWDGSPAEYAAVVTEGADAIRRAHPGAQVLLGGMVWPDAAWLEVACGNGNAARIDVVPIHAYPETWTPESVTVETYLDVGYREQFLPTVDTDCGGKPVWVNETGYATAKGRTERDQAAWWARAAAVFAADPRVTHVGVYEIKDLRPTSDVIGDAENYHLGLLRADRTPKLAFATVKLMVRLLDGPITVRDAELRVSPASGVAPAPAPGAAPADVHAFERADGTQVVVAWVRRGRPARTVDVTLPRPGGTARSYALDGAWTAVGGFDGRTLRGVRLDAGEVRIFEVAPPTAR